MRASLTEAGGGPAGQHIPPQSCPPSHTLAPRASLDHFVFEDSSPCSARGGGGPGADGRRSSAFQEIVASRKLRVLKIELSLGFRQFSSIKFSFQRVGPLVTS